MKKNCYFTASSSQSSHVQALWSSYLFTSTRNDHTDTSESPRWTSCQVYETLSYVAAFANRPWCEDGASSSWIGSVRSSRRCFPWSTCRIEPVAMFFIFTSPSDADDPDGPQTILLAFPCIFLLYSSSSCYRFGSINFQTGHNILGLQLTGLFSLLLAVFIVLSTEPRSKAVLWRCLPGNKAKQRIRGVVREAVTTRPLATQPPT